MSKYIEDDYSSSIIHGFKIEDNPKIEMIRITTVNSNCSNMFDMDFEYNYFLDYRNRDLLIELLSSEGYYHGDLYEALKEKHGEYLERHFDWKENGISFIEDCFYCEPSKSKYADFADYKTKDELESRYTAE